eukprot:m.26164 g.26164  ORF g.26164 m.26164 type:complete len:334 (+) comp5830_c0_seq4:272-1273(+)
MNILFPFFSFGFTVILIMLAGEERDISSTVVDGEEVGSGEKRIDKNEEIKMKETKEEGDRDDNEYIPLSMEEFEELLIADRCGDGAKDVIRSMKTRTCEAHIDLKSKRLGVNAGKAIGDALFENDIVETLNIGDVLMGGNSIGDEGVTVLAAALKYNHKLKTLNISCNGIKNDGAVALGEALKVNDTLETLGLFWNKIGGPGGRAIGEALALNKALQLINLTDNNLGNEGAIGFATGLRSNSTFQILYLEGNKIGDEGAEKLGEMLSENNGLTWVTLDRNKVSNEGAGHLRKGLKRNKTMKSIYVLKNKLKEDEKKRMEALLGKHASLEQVGV